MSTQIKNRDHTAEYLVKCKMAIETLQENGESITHDKITELAEVPKAFTTHPFYKYMFDQAFSEYIVKEMGHDK